MRFQGIIESLKMQQMTWQTDKTVSKGGQYVPVTGVNAHMETRDLTWATRDRELKARFSSEYRVPW